MPPAVEYLKVEGVYRKPDFLLRFDHLDLDFADFLAEAGIPAPAALPRVNAKKVDAAEIERARTDEALLEIAVSRYGEDFECFDYPLP